MSRLLAERAYEALKRDIISCKLRPGQAIVETELASTYGMSKTPIREALNLLRKEGFVQILPRRGTLVKPIDVTDVQHTFLLRMLLEPEAAALAAVRATGAQLRQLRELATATESSGARAVSEQRDLLRANRLFHVAIAEASGVSRLAAVIASLHEEIERFYNAERPRVPGAPVGKHHHDLLEALVAGDADLARSLMVERIRASRQHLIDAIIGEPGVAGLSVVDRSA